VNPSPDKTSKVKIEEALSGVVDVAKAANAETADPAVISDPSRFWGQEQEGSELSRRGLAGISPGGDHASDTRGPAAYGARVHPLAATFSAFATGS
jgi:hypothetical protein